MQGIWAFIIGAILCVLLTFFLSFGIIFNYQKGRCALDPRFICHADWRCGEPDLPADNAFYVVREQFLNYSNNCLFGADCEPPSNPCENFKFNELKDAGTKVDPYNLGSDKAVQMYTNDSQNICDPNFYPPGLFN